MLHETNFTNPMKMTKIPPVAQVIIFAIIAWVASNYVPIFNFRGAYSIPLSIITGGLGLVLVIWSVGQFRRANTSVDPMSPESAERFLTSGFYRITRNPMYLGMALLLFAWVFYIGAFSAIIGAAGFITCMSIWQIPFEEAALSKRFGTEYQKYKATVRRWI